MSLQDLLKSAQGGSTPAARGSSGLRGLLQDSSQVPERTRQAQADAEAAQFEAQHANSFSALAGSTVKGIAQGAADMLTGATRQFGKTIGGSLGANRNVDLYTQATQQQSDVMGRLLRTRENVKARGGDTTRIDGAIKQLQDATPKVEDFTGDVINTTKRQVFGQAIGTALEMLSGGILEGGAKTALSKELTTGQKFLQGAKIGSVYGGVGSASGAMAGNESAGQTLKAGIKGSALGALLGGSLEVAGGALAKGKPVETKAPLAPEVPGAAIETPAVSPGATAPAAQIELPAGPTPSGSAKSIAARAVKEGLIKDFEESGLAGYTPTTREIVAAKVSNIVDKGPDEIRKILSGEKPLPADIPPTAFAEGVNKYATETVDGELVRDLLKSPYAAQGSVAGQNLGFVGENGSVSPLKAMQELATTKAKKVGGDLGKATRSEVATIEKTIAKTAPKKQSWAEFINSIEC